MERARRESGGEALKSPEEDVVKKKRERKYPSLLPHEKREFFFMDEDPARYPVPDPDEVYYRPPDYGISHKAARKKARNKELELRNERAAREYEEELVKERGYGIFPSMDQGFSFKGIIRTDNIWVNPKNAIIYAICSGCGKEITHRNTEYCPRCGKLVEGYVRKGRK